MTQGHRTRPLTPPAPELLAANAVRIGTHRDTGPPRGTRASVHSLAAPSSPQAERPGICGPGPLVLSKRR